ncbi:MULTISPECIES: hypothetical protein [unclassified Janthinobacterium]|uniref:hypothetical protein n=1 Tax=unclassified Janthinobacterium TaxID=2610881 RepID=UPI001E344233|nr:MULTISPECIES: hypothetical protein [unclassified Janthinobacterium]MCC7644623.1 hypothetical protein [Janthinobacterium sp. EB271-G4-3-1]MCC7692632.1 hypothetical protein [Janthinobacterium sp. EB271-G4-3-2]
MRQARPCAKRASIPRWDKATANAGWSLSHGYVMLLSGRLAITESGGDLSPAMMPRFFQLPVEALTPAQLS